MSVLGFPLSFVIRNFKSEKIDNWWNARRGKLGNKNINRRGAFRELVRELKRGFDVGILFDQNVKRSHAVFVPWFGKNAATAKSLALAALETEALVVVVSLKTLAIDSYYMDVIECDFSHIYSDETLSRQEKILQITTIVSKHYEKMIQDFPEGWFWMHRRWKTSEREDVPETFYK